MPAPVLAAAVRGISPLELARRSCDGHEPVTGLAQWAVEAGFASMANGLVVPTPLGVEVGAVLEEIELDSAKNRG